MERKLEYRIETAQQGMRMIDFLRTQGFSRHTLRGLKEFSDGILLNGRHAYGSTLLKSGDLVSLRLADQKENEKIVPVQMDLHILYEDEDLLVINKPADTPVHPSPGNYGNTLANGVSWHFQQKGERHLFRCINRLDRDTTGALILAKHSYSASRLSHQMKERNIRRTYLALVQGKTPLRGTVNAPIARVQGSAILREVNFTSGESACTHYERLDYHNGLSLLELHLDTGRTHQIRVHMKYLGFPLIGDYLYHPDYTKIRRQALHSYQLEFCHPITGQPLCFQAPVPEDFRQAFGNFYSPPSLKN